MSTLGAQARAAELAAAVIAKKRLQALRELDEQAAARQVNPATMDATVPPKNPTVSLSAFMKPAPVNRNKGAKAWKPLDVGSFEDLSEDDNVCDKTELDTTSTMSNHSFTASNGSSNTTVEARATIDTTGPRVMRLNFPPQPIQQQRLPGRPPPAQNMAHLLPHRLTMASQVVSSIGRRVIQESPISHANNSNPGATPAKLSNGYMVPDDLSPTKQEMKLDALKRQQNKCDDQAFDDSHQFQIPQHFAASRSSFTQSPPCYSHHPPQVHQRGYSWGHDSVYQMTTHFNDPTTFGNDGFAHTMRNGQLITDPNRPCVQPRQQPYDTKAAMQKFLAEQAEKSKTDKGKTVLCNPDLYNQPNKGNGLDESGKGMESNQEAVDTLSSAVPQKRFSPLSKPYDCFATSKRILSEPSRPSRVDVLKSALSKASSLHTLPRLAFPSIAAGAQNSSDKVIGQLAIEPNEDYCSDEGPNDIDNDRPFCEGQNLPTSFFELAPMTFTERKKTQACMAKAARNVTLNFVETDNNDENEQKEIFADYNRPAANDAEARHQAIAQLMSADHRGQAKLRKESRRISVAHAVKHRTLAVAVAAAQANITNVSNNVVVSGGRTGALPEGFRLGVDDQLVGGLALGDIACNIQSYLVGSEDEDDTLENDTTQKDGQYKFNRVRGVPDWCTEKPRVWSTSSNTIFGEGEGAGEEHSYFGGAWGVPPARMARDPRFNRPNIAGSEVNMMSMGMNAGISMGAGVGMALRTGMGGSGATMGGGDGATGGLSFELERRRLLEAQIGRRPATMY